MPKRTDLHKILVIGSGPIVIGQAAEFDYAGTQACLALREEGYEVVLANSNPATIMTDTTIADKVYMEPLTVEYLAKILRFERPDAVVPGIGGQTGLNLAMELQKQGVLEECGVELLGTKYESIRRAEDRELFKELCLRLGEPVVPSEIATDIDGAVQAAAAIGYPVILRPAFTLGGTGGGFAGNVDELRTLMRTALELSPVGQVLIEKSIKGYKEIEYEVMRDANDTAITVCNMENIDPVGIHTGDSIVVSYTATLNENANTGTTGNKNTAKLTYTENNTPKDTPEDTVIVFTFNGIVNKVDPEGKPLTGAEFELVKVEDDGTKSEPITVTLNDEKTSFTFAGLKAGKYILTETKAPEGYNKLEKPIYFVIEYGTTNDDVPVLNKLEAYQTDENWKKVESNATAEFVGNLNPDDANVSTNVVNGEGIVLPDTGGIGTTIFTIGGCAIMILAAALYFASRRKTAK